MTVADSVAHRATLQRSRPGKPGRLFLSIKNFTIRMKESVDGKIGKNLMTQRAKLF